MRSPTSREAMVLPLSPSASRAAPAPTVAPRAAKAPGGGYTDAPPHPEPQDKRQAPRPEPRSDPVLRPQIELKYDRAKVISSTEALYLEKAPATMAIVGAGAVVRAFETTFGFGQATMVTGLPGPSA